MLTAAAYGVDQFLFVYGDKPTAGDRTSELTVRAMIEQARVLDLQPLRIGVAAGPRKLPGWKRTADFVFSQMSFSVEQQLRWRESVALDVPVYAGVMVLASANMARTLAAAIPDIDIPPSLVEAVERDRSAGVEAAVEQIQLLRDSGAFEGVHLVPVSRYREMA